MSVKHKCKCPLLTIGDVMPLPSQHVQPLGTGSKTYKLAIIVKEVSAKSVLGTLVSTGNPPDNVPYSEYTMDAVCGHCDNRLSSHPGAGPFAVELRKQAAVIIKYTQRQTIMPRKMWKTLIMPPSL